MVAFFLRERLLIDTVKVKWKSAKNDHDNGGYNENILRHLFEKYGKVNNIIVSVKKTGLAIIEFLFPAHAQMALEFEHGLAENPVNVSWLQGPKFSEDTAIDQTPNGRKPADGNSKECKEREFTATTQGIDEDFENTVLNRMKMAQKNKASDKDST